MKVYVVDDDPQLRAGLVQRIQAAGFPSEDFGSGQAFLEAYPRLDPGCLIVDLLMPGMSGHELHLRLLALGCHWPIVIVTGQGDCHSVADATGAGAIAFLEKPVRDAELLAALLRAQALLLGRAEPMPDPELASRVVRLTPRERQVLDGVLAGMLNKQIAARLGISERTVREYRGTLMRKLGARNVTELIMLAIRAGIPVKPRE